jgi:glycosyltransferase involved in cell wall biosynthesis
MVPSVEKPQQTGPVELTIIMPCYNEEASLPVVLPPLLQLCAEQGWKLIAINDGSADRTGQVLQGFTQHACLDIITHKVNRGYGAAIATGIYFCETSHAVTIDADGQHSLDDIARLLAFQQAEDADLVIGQRVETGLPDVFRLIGKKIILFIARALFPQLKIKDLNSGFKLYKADIAKVLAPYCPESMAFSDIMTLMFVNNGLKVVEHPITVKKRLAGKSTISVKTAIDTVLEIITVVMLFKPLRFFIVLACIFFIGGLIQGVRYLLMGTGLSVAALLLLLTSIIMVTTGLLAEQNAILTRAALNNNYQIRIRGRSL